MLGTNYAFTAQTVEDYGSIVKQVSAEYSRRYPMVSREDIAQELWLWFATHRRKMANWLADDSKNQKDVDRLVAKSLRNAAYDYCLKEKAQKEGYAREDLFFYSKEIIKMFLPVIVSGDWSRARIMQQNHTRSTTSLSESGDWMAYIADIKKALEALSEEERHIIVEFYGHDIDRATLYEEILPGKPNANAAAEQANRILNKMVRSLGGRPPFYDRKDNDVRDEEESAPEDSADGVEGEVSAADD